MLQARAVLDLAEALDERARAAGRHPAVADVELPLVHLLADMERTGVAVDIDHLESLSRSSRAR